MKIELQENKILFNNGLTKQEIHPFWLEKDWKEEEYLDKGTNQRFLIHASLIVKLKLNR